MPHGCSGAIPPIIETIAHHKWDHGELQRYSVLDVGAGRGCNGVAIRSYHDEAIHSLVGIEGHAPSRWLGSQEGIRSAWDAYDQMIQADLMDEIPRMLARGQHYSIGLCTEVIEHLDRPDGLRLLEWMPQLADHWLLTTPDREVGVAWQDVQFQGHVSLWTVEDFRSRGWRILKPPSGEWCELGWPMVMAYLGTWDLSSVLCYRVEGDERDGE